MPMTGTYDAHRSSLDYHVTVLDDDLLYCGFMVMMVSMVSMVCRGREGDEGCEEGCCEEGEFVHDLCFL